MKALINYNRTLGLTGSLIFLTVAGFFLATLPKPDAYQAAGGCFVAMGGILFYVYRCNESIRKEFKE